MQGADDRASTAGARVTVLTAAEVQAVLWGNSWGFSADTVGFCLEQCLANASLRELSLSYINHGTIYICFYHE